MTSKKARSMAGLPWIAAMAFFMQALDATILNTALPAIAPFTTRHAVRYYQLYPDSSYVNSGKRLAG